MMQLLSMEKTSINYTYRDGDVCFSFPEEPTLRNNQIWQKNGNAMTQVNRGKASKNPKINSDPALCDSSDGEDVEQLERYHYA